MKPAKQIEVHGHVQPGFEAVRQAFIQNFAELNELGGAVCVYHKGENVVDLWGGIRDVPTNAAWEQDTMVLVFSLTKGMSALAIALAHSRGLLDYEVRVAEYWPEFAQNGKGAITVRQLLSHQAGLQAYHQKVDKAILASPDRLADIMAQETPAFKPGTRNAYHMISLGFYESELIRRVDPKHRTLGRFFQDEIATPLDLEFFIRVPENIPNGRLARLEQANIFKALISLPLPMTLALMNPRSHLFRSYMVNPGAACVFDKDRLYARELEVPSGGGVGTARAIAKAYGLFAAGGDALGITAETLAALKAPAIAPTEGFHDVVVKGDAKYSLGFMKPFPGFSFGHPEAFGAPGAGGSLGYADPATGIGYGYVTNRIGVGVDPDPRDKNLRKALASVVG